MILRKSLKRGQTVLEYFILLSLIVIMSILSISELFPKIKTTLFGNATEDGFFQKTVKRITE